MHTEQFLRHFQGRHLFVAIYENEKVLDPKPKPIHLLGTYKEHKAKLDELNSKGWGIYLTINETQGKRRTKSDIEKCRAIWIDDDEPRDAPRDGFPIPPNIIVNTSLGKYHYYWLTETEDLNQWNGVMATMVKDHGCDNSSKDLARILRIPGFNHNKKEPYPVKIINSPDEISPYSWSDILKAFPPLVSKDSQGKMKYGEYRSQEECVNDIIKGDDFHKSFQSVISNHANHTLHKDTLMTLARGIGYQALFSGKLSEARHQRLTYMLSDDSIEIEEMVNWAIQSTEEEQNVEIPDPIVDAGIITYELTYPPGLMGQLCEEIYEMAPHPNKEVAIMGGFALVAGIIGRKFNILDMGLNLYIALLADSGIGKANIKNVINKTLVASEKNMKGGTYKGHSRFTGPRAIFEMLMNGLSRVCVLEEAGLMNLSTAGDQVGINRALLDIYTSSGKSEYAGGEAYSDTKSTIPLIKAPALTIAHVSTPQSFLKALKAKDSTTSGEMARLWTMRSMNDKELLNRAKRSDFSANVLDRLQTLMVLCSDRQSDTDRNKNSKEGQVRDIKLPKDVFNDSDRYTKLENTAKHNGDTLKRTILSRAFAKSLKIAAVVSVFNGDEEILSEDAYTWAKDEAVGKEIRYIEDSYTHESSDDLILVAKTVGLTILKIIHRSFKDEKKNADPRLAKYGMFTRTNVHQVLRNNQQLKDWDDNSDRNNPVTGVDKMLNYMAKRGLLEVISELKMKSYGSKAQGGYKITEDFKTFMDL